MLDFAKDQKLWERVRTSDDFARHRKEIKELYDHFFEEPPRVSTFKEIYTLNDPSAWNRLFQLMSSAMMSLIYPDNEEYFDNLLETLWVYCDEYTWAALGHYNEYYNRTPADYDIGLIDIYGASMGFTIAEIKNLMGDRIPKLLRDRISAELKRHIIDPYCERTYFWEKHPNNWSAVCAGGVGGVLIYEAPDVYLKYKDRLNASMQVYIDSYKDDGVCAEGCAYWGFGFGFFADFAMLQREFSGGKDDWFKNEKVKKIAMFIQKTFLQRDVLITFSDCNTTEGYWLGLPHMLKNIYGDDIEKLPSEAATITRYQHFSFLLRSVIYYNPDYVADDIDKNVTYFMPESAWLTKRTENYGIALKGGNNGESHNHNDIGNFILARNDKQIICDIGAGPYSPDYHGAKRYTFFAPSSFSHNVPFFDGIGQDGVRRDDVMIDFDEKNSKATLDITNGYGYEAVKKVVRTFTLNEDNIKVEDEFELKEGTVTTERFVTTIKPTEDGKYLLVDDVRLVPRDDISPKISVVQSPNHATAGYTDVYCIDYILPVGTKKFGITFETPKK